MTGIDSNLLALMAKGMTLEEAINHSVASVTISALEYEHLTEAYRLLKLIYANSKRIPLHLNEEIEKLIKNELNP